MSACMFNCTETIAWQHACQTTITKKLAKSGDHTEDKLVNFSLGLGLVSSKVSGIFLTNSGVYVTVSQTFSDFSQGDVDVCVQVGQAEQRQKT